MSDAPLDPSPHDDDPGPGPDWLSDAPVADEASNSAIWPTEAVDMVPLPGFTLDDDSVLVPLPTAGGDDEPVEDAPIGSATAASRPSGQRVRLPLGARAGAGVLGAAILTVVVVSGGIGLPTSGSTGPLQTASPPVATPVSSATSIDTAWAERLSRAVKRAQERQRRQAAARRKTAQKAASLRAHARSAPTPSPGPVETQVSSPRATVHSAPADPWAGVPGPVREFEPGPWNNGGSS